MLRCCGYLFDKPLEFGVGVGDGIGEEDLHVGLVKVVLKLQLETLSLRPIPTGSLHKLDIIAQLLTPVLILRPNHPLLPPTPNRFPHIGPHPLIIQILGFANITNIDLHFANFIKILDTEIIPVTMSFRVGVTANETVILVGMNFDDEVKVGGLEVGGEVVLGGLGFGKGG